MAKHKKSAAKATKKTENSDELPQAITESYGTGVIDQPGLSESEITLDDSISEDISSSAQLTGGDVDTDWEQASASGEEAVGGSAPTPDQNIVDDLGVAAGVEIPDEGILHTTEMLEHRDESRWELDPSSAEDSQERS